MSRLVVACYQRIDSYLQPAGDPIALVAHVEQLEGDSVDSPFCLVWHDATLADFKRLDFDAEELMGAVEVIEARFQELEDESCRLASVRQRLGSEAAA